MPQKQLQLFDRHRFGTGKSTGSNHTGKYLFFIDSQGYFDQFLADNSDIKVIGIERNEAFVNEAIRRQEKSFWWKYFKILYIF